MEAPPVRHLIRSVVFQADGVIVNYAGVEDVRESGLLLNHSLFIPFEEQFVDPIDELLIAARHALEHALATFAEEPVPSIQPPPDEDEPSPYDNPDERPGVRS
jgi:hypothetical protein